MNYTRLELPRRTLSKRSKLLIEFCIIMPLASIIVGSLVSKVFIFSIQRSPVPLNTSNNIKMINTTKVVNKEATATNANTKKKEIKVQNILSYYYIQGGIYSNYQNGNNALNKLKSIGANGFLMKDKNLYRIVLNVSNNKDVLKDNQEMLKTKGCETLIKQKTLITNNQVDSVLEQEYIKTIGKVIECQFNMMYKTSIDRNKSMKGYMLAVDNVKTSYKKISEANIDKKNKYQIDQFHSEFIKYINQFDKSFGKNGIEICTRSVTGEVIILDNLYMFNLN